MNSQQKAINLLTICRKAGRVIMGFDAVKDAALEKGVSCVIVSDDISLKTLKEVKFFCNNTHTKIIRLDIDSADVFDALGKEVVVMAIADYGFAKRFEELGTLVKPTVPRSMKKNNEQNK